MGLLNLAEGLGHVSMACQMLGLSRDTFYRYRSTVKEGGIDSCAASAVTLFCYRAAKMVGHYADRLTAARATDYVWV